MISERHASAPFGAVRASYPDGSGAAEVQVTNPSGGVLGGDRLELDVALEPGASATVVTQGATKAYRGAEARGDAVFRVGPGAFLEHLPHHLIPYAGSNFRQTAEFRLAGDATLIAWDACAAGRVARGERFAFGSLGGRTRVFREGLPEAVDGFELRGGGEPFGGYLYLGSLYVLAPADLSPLAEKLHGLLGDLPEVLGSASAPGWGLCAVRVLAPGATALYGAFNACRAAARSALGFTAPPRKVW